MRWKIAITVLALAMLACTALGTPLSQPESAPLSGSTLISEGNLEGDTPTATPAPFTDDTPLPSTVAAPIVSLPNIISLHMLSELDGWAISENVILRTTDGGSTWYNLSPQGVTEFGYGIANSFLNASQAWVLTTDAADLAGSGRLYRTRDGGLTWTVYTVPFGSGDLTFVGDSTGWMMAFLGAGAGSMGIAIFTTADGGATWKQTFTNDPNLENSGDSLPLGGIKSDLTPLDASTAWVSGVIYAPATFYFYKTVDGGQSWTVQPLPVPPGIEDADVAIDSGPIFVSPNEGFLAVHFFGETMRTGFYTTHDGGLNWEFIAFLPGFGTADFVSLSDGYFWTGEQFFFTSDGAQTWTTINSDVLFGESFAGMDFVNTRTGWVWTYEETGQRGLYKTTDGGKTWFPMDSR